MKSPAVPPIETKRKFVRSLFFNFLPTKSSVVLITVRLKRDVGSASIVMRISLCDVLTLKKENT